MTDVMDSTSSVHFIRPYHFSASVIHFKVITAHFFEMCLDIILRTMIMYRDFLSWYLDS